MCHFITATLPKDADLKKAEEIFKVHHLGFRQIENDSVFEHLEKGDVYILTTRGMCDCGTTLASKEDASYQPDKIESQKYKDNAVKKLKAKGWSNNKIRRWYKEFELNREKTALIEKQSPEHTMTGANDWVNFIQDILQSNASKRIGILVHEYSSGLHSRIKILGKEKVESKNLTSKFLVEMSEDIIYDFVS